MAISSKDLYVKTSGIPNAGEGLFTKVYIPKGTKIVEYTGVVTSWADADYQEGLNPYIYYVNDDYVIDASKRKKSLGRYANDARGMKKIKGLSNNAEYVEEELKVFIVASKNIPPDSEIFVGYGKEYWDVLKKNYADLEQGL
jgi:SET domain-containing protein